MKKVLSLAVLALVAALSLASFEHEAHASPEGSYMYHQIIVNGPATIGTQGLVSGSTFTTPASLATPLSVATFLGGVAYTPYRVGSADTSTGGVYTSTIVPVASSYETLMSSGGQVLLTSIPNIATTTLIAGTTSLYPIPNGFILTFGSSATATDGVTFQSSSVLTGSGLSLGASSRTVNSSHILSVIWDADSLTWKESYYR